MTQLNFHNNLSILKTSTRGIPAVIIKEKETYTYWLVLYRNFPKSERFSLGQKISHLFIQILEYTFTASYLPIDKKIILLGKIIPRHDVLKFFIQLAWGNKCISTDKYMGLSQMLEEIGRQLGGWRNGLIEKQKKTPVR